MPEAHPAVRGVFNMQNGVIPVVDLSMFLTGNQTPLDGRFRVVVTEFFGRLNAFLVENVEAVHTVMWENVMDAQNVLRGKANPYVISIVQPDEDKMILLLDYETIILEIMPEKVKEEVTQAEEIGLTGNNSKILLAEDSSSVRDMLELELTEHGFRVITARDGQDALEKLQQNPDLALVVSDVEMPRTDGLAFTKAIKENPETAHIPVLVYSSIGDVGMKERAKYLKAEDHITKLNLDELFTKIGEILKLPQQVSSSS
jgi:two-component system, chemotaxis family, chemotaxis protein CheV